MHLHYIDIPFYNHIAQNTKHQSLGKIKVRHLWHCIYPKGQPVQWTKLVLETGNFNFQGLGNITSRNLIASQPTRHQGARTRL